MKSKKAQLSAGGGGLEKQLEDVVASLADVNEAQDRIAGVEAFDQKVRARGIDNNPHTNITLADITAQWHQYLLLLKKKQVLLEEQIEEAKRRGLTKEQVDEIKNNFAYFDSDHSGQLSKKELKVCLQSLGEESRPQDVAAIMAEYDQKATGQITYEEFQRFMFKQLGDTDTETEIARGFKFLAAGKDDILAVEMQNVVNDKSFKDHHVNYLLANIPSREPGFDYATWTAAAFAR
jgi:Ca2+-binding EF-hand superfamily protein